MEKKLYSSYRDGGNSTVVKMPETKLEQWKELGKSNEGPTQVFTDTEKFRVSPPRQKEQQGGKC